MLKGIDFGFKFVILFLQVPDKKGCLLWISKKLTAHGVELFVKFIKLDTFLFVKGLIVSHGKIEKFKRSKFFSVNECSVLIFFIIILTYV